MTLTQIPMPKTGAQIKRDTRGFFDRAHKQGEVNADGLLAHGLAVLERAEGVRMFDNDPIVAARALLRGNTRTPRAKKLGVHEVELDSDAGKAVIRRGIANTQLAEVILFHSADPQVHMHLGNTVIDPKRLEWELDVFRRLINLDLKGTQATDDEYAEVLGERRSLIAGFADDRFSIAPLAFLARIADLAVTHINDGEEERDISPFVKNGHPSRYFREYDTFDDVVRGVGQYAHAARILYGPAAERLGYPQLSGDLYEQAIYVEERHIYDHVLAKLNDPQTKAVLEETKRRAKILRAKMADSLRAQGFEFEIEIREIKHRGKIMNKLSRKVAELCTIAQSEVPADKRESEREYFFKNKGLFSVLDFHDIVALRVKIKGKVTGDEYREIKGFIDEPSTRALDRAKQTVLNAIEDTFGRRAKIDAEHKKRDNGYEGLHFDITNTGVCNVEVQLKTEEWHLQAEHGGAAHFMYLGGNKGRNSLVSMLGDLFNH